MTDAEIEKIAKEAVKAERRRIVEAIQGLANKDEVIRLIFPQSETEKKEKPKWGPIQNSTMTSLEKK